MRKGNRIGVDGFDPCVVLLNNDLSAGIPKILENLEQAGDPAAVCGLVHAAASRNHFAAYEKVAEEFGKRDRHRSLARESVFRRLRGDQFQERQGEDCLAGYVETVLDAGTQEVRANTRSTWSPSSS